MAAKKKRPTLLMRRTDGVMTHEAAAKLRENWQKQGNAPCEHRVLEEEEKTGEYICTRCGAVVPKRKLRKVKEEDEPFYPDAD